jgi:hypothetical protein
MIAQKFKETFFLLSLPNKEKFRSLFYGLCHSGVDLRVALEGL